MQTSWLRYFLPRLLAGLALTILLLFLLSTWLGVPTLPSQARSTEHKANVWASPADIDGEGTVLRQPDNSALHDSVTAQANEVTQASENSQMQVEVTKSSLQPVHIPKDIRLSAEELADLSPKARERYQAMRAALVELREQALTLQREREAIEQRMLEMERRNQALSETLQAQPPLSEE